MENKEIYSKKYAFLKETQNITIFVIVTFKVPYKFICLGLVERAKFQIVIFFANHGRGSFKALQLLLYLWSFSQKPKRTEEI